MDSCKIKFLKFFFLPLLFGIFIFQVGWGQTLFDTYSDGDFTASPVWGGNTTLWTIDANSTAAAGATGSNTLRLNGPAVSQTDYLSSQISSWGVSQEWNFFIGRRAQAFTAANQAYFWLYSNESTLNNTTVDGYRLAIGDDTGDDNIRLEYIVDGALSTTVITSSGTVTNTITDIGFLVRVTRSSLGVWEIFTSALPTVSGTGAIATDVPSAANTPTSQGSATNNTLVPADNGYLGVAALHSTGASAIVSTEFDQIYFTPTGNSTSSDIITANNETLNIDYASKTAASITATTDAIRVWSFTIRDGGGVADGDAVGTILTAVTINKGGSNGVTSWANTAKQAALYDGATEVAEITVTGEIMVFSSFSVTAADGGNKTLDLYLTFETTNITDNQQFQFRIQKTNTTTDAAGSSFAAFADVTSSITGDNNRIEVTATKLNFVQQPTNTGINTAMSPSVTVEAADANNQRDLDFTGSIRITSTGTLTGSPVDVAASSGLATFSALTHTVTGTGLTLNAEKTATLDWDITSSAFDILNIYTTLLDNYDGVGNLTYTTEGTWDFSGAPNDEYDSYADSNTVPEHSYASYNLSNSFPDWNLNNANENSWCGWMDLNRASVSGWGASNYSCAMVLAANSSDFNAPATSGIAIGFRDDDILVLFRFSAGIVSGTVPLPGTSALMVATTYTYADANNGVNFFVEYLPDGTWKVYWLSGANLSDANAVNKANYTGGNVTSGIDNTYTGTTYSYAGWAYAHSSGGSDNAFFDNFSAGQETSATTITTSAITGSPFCVTASATAAVSVAFTSTGTFTGTNDYTAQLSDATGSFSSPVNIGSLINTSANSGTISATIPAGTVSGTGYRIRVIANDPATNGTNNGTDLIIVLGPENVTGVSATAGNTQATISWTNSATCFDQILVVGKATTSVTALPTGDGTLYTANSVFSAGGSGANLPANEYAVYKNSGSSVIVTGLTNGTQYCFKIFTRKGTTWSSGVEQCVTPALITTLIGGDLAILGIDANHAGSCGGGAGDDEISFVCFKDIVTGTVLDFTDNGWQRTTAVKWGNTEGTIRMTRTGGTIAAGVVMTLSVDESKADAAAGRYSIIMPVGGGWTFAEINFTGDFNMNSGGDQIYFMQGGTWNGGTYGNHDATYTGGEILFGFSTTGTWIDYGLSTQKSGLYPNNDCFSMAPTSSTDFDKYTGPLTAATQREWIGRINDPLNWTSYATCSAYASGGTNFAGGYTITINAGGFAPGKWIGATSTDWFNCANWEALQIPDAATNVSLPAAGVTFDPLIAIAGALSNNLANESPRVLTINGTGTLTISGDLTNNSTITHTAGTVTFNGASPQSIGGSSTTTFFNLTLNNSSSTGLTLNKPVNINGALTLTDGFLLTDATNILTILDNATSTSGSAASFVDGPIKKTGNDVFVFPTGDGTKWARIGITAPATATTEYTAEYFATGYGTYTLAAGPPTLNNVSNKEYWTLAQAVTTEDVQVTLYWEDDDFSGINDCDGTPDDLRIAHWTGTAWEINVDGVIITGSCLSGGGAQPGTLQTNASQPFYSPFAFGSKSSAVNPLPVELLDFSGRYDVNNVELNWKTASEINNDYFTVQRSSDGENFIPIGLVKGAGNSNSALSYNFKDSQFLILNSQIFYYRLKQTDYDEKFSYSNIVRVQINSEELSRISFYANNEDKTISFFGERSEVPLLIVITDVSGKVIFQNEFSQNKILIETIDCRSFSSGMYFLRIENGENPMVGKFVFY